MVFEPYLVDDTADEAGIELDRLQRAYQVRQILNPAIGDATATEEDFGNLAAGWDQGVNANG